MSNVPVSLNIFNNGKMWKTRRLSGVWEPETLWFSDPNLADTGPQQFSANPVVSSLSDLSTLTFTSDQKLYFVDNTGAATLVGNITNTSGLTVGFRVLSTQWDQYWGPFQYGGANFFAGAQFLGSPSFNFRMAMYTGPETGAATEQDAAGSPVYGDGFTDAYGGCAGIFWDGSSRYVYFALIDSTSFYTVNIYRFDMQTSTWSGVLTNFDAGSFVNYIIYPERGRFVVFGNGDYGFLWSGKTTDTFPGTWYVRFDGASWGTPVQVDASGTALATIAFDPSLDRIDVFTYSSLFNPVQADLKSIVNYSQVTRTGVVSSVLTTIPAPVGDTDGVNQGVASVTAGLLAVPRDDQADPSNAIWECAINGPYVFTKTLLPTPPSPGTQLSCAMIFYTQGPASVEVPVGSLILTGFAPSTSSSSALRVACPLQASGTVGIPYSSAVIASGGFPPYSFAVISGALPPGLSLDPATGIISGTPTAQGTYHFVVQVTDSHAQTAVTPGCPITIVQSAQKCAVQLTSDINPQQEGQTVTLIAFLQPATLTGNVKFFADGVLIGTAAVANGQASLQVMNLLAGVRVITASYNGAPLPVCVSCPLRQVITPILNPGTPCNPITN